LEPKNAVCFELRLEKQAWTHPISVNQFLIFILWFIACHNSCISVMEDERSDRFFTRLLSFGRFFVAGFGYKRYVIKMSNWEKKWSESWKKISSHSHRHNLPRRLRLCLCKWDVYHSSCRFNVHNSSIKNLCVACVYNFCNPYNSLTRPSELEFKLYTFSLNPK
jgi:hypothetical protein